MNISDLGEFGLIRKIQKLSSQASPNIVTGIGDDAAVLKTSPSALLLATTDMLIEGVHFDLTYTDYFSLGWKSAAVNLSDIAAMGGVPRFCLTSLGIPRTVNAEQVVKIYRGFNALMRRNQTVLVGGDTCASPSGLIISVTVLGETNKKNAITRAGAKPGDRIFVTGTLGDSAAGMEFLQLRAGSKGLATSGQGHGSRVKGPAARENKLVQRHLRPIPRIEWGRTIALSGCASAMIDISDGLSSDLAHICELSGVGAVIDSQSLPVSASLLKTSEKLKTSLLRYVLSGGEDYELLFTVTPSKVKKLRSFNLPVTDVGTITTTGRILMVDEHGAAKSLRPAGYDHFDRSGSSLGRCRRTS
jgi:thiamine-monophosphate kinase